MLLLKFRIPLLDIRLILRLPSNYNRDEVVVEIICSNCFVTSFILIFRKKIPSIALILISAALGVGVSVIFELV